MQRGWPNSDEDREYPSRGRRKYERTGAVEGEGGGGRELARAKPTRALLTLTFARARARARACVYMQTRHMGRRDDRQSGRPLRRKRAERMSRVANRREKTYERKDGPRSRGEGTGVYVPPILITSSYKPTIQRSTATPHRRPP